ncbi:hypothetical protein AJ78_04322 [Emergomyces pasteurianus Ep9510]|uniref:Myb-like domain-containing protein n=1 Tax=Emergomyces pasteurianus Ep9510 TaxID=1447872 RepID=A0A1J9PHD6_9EURO|nr:hypothetical protein AJ78_04322 [Emergomyces pasteurianus Ep9510]
MALPQRRAHRDTSIGPAKFHIPRRSQPSFSATQNAWNEKASSQRLRQQACYGNPQQPSNSASKLEILDSTYAIPTGSEFTESKCDTRGLVQPRNQQHYRNPETVEAQFDGLPGPMISPDASIVWANLAECRQERQPSPCFLATITPGNQRHNNSTTPTVAQSLSRSSLDRYQDLETTEVPHNIPRLQAQKFGFKNFHDSWEKLKTPGGMYVDDGLNQQGDIHPGWSEHMGRMTYTTISNPSDTNIESTYPATTERLDQASSRRYALNFMKETANLWQGVQNFIQQPQRWPGEASPSFVTHTGLPMNELHTVPLGYQCSPNSSFSSCFTPDALHEPANFDSPGFHDMSAPMGYFDQIPRRDRLTGWQGHLPSVEPFELNITTTKLPGRPRKTKACETQAAGNTGSQRTSAKDEYLIRCKRAGMSYKDIKEKGNFSEAESTLRGRFRTLTKRKEQRVRKPGWQEKDVRLLCEAVRRYANPTHGGTGENITSPTISWKQVGEYIWKNGGSYHFGNATCKKKWGQIQQNVIILRPEHQFG